MKQAQESKQEQLTEEINSFYKEVSNYSYLDVQTAVNVFLEVGLSGYDLAKEVNNYSEETGTDIENIDVCYISFENILQQAREKIDEVLGYDFLNDFKGSGQEIYTYGNYMATSYDYSTEAQEELQDKITKATEEQKKELRTDKKTKWFLDSVDISV